MTKAQTKPASQADRRKAAQEQARKLREAQAKRERRNRILLIGGIVVAVAAVVAIVWFVVSEGNRSAIEGLEDEQVPANTRTEDGGITLGSDMVAGGENSGAAELSIYLDFACPHCLTFEEMHAEDIDQLVESGEATVIYHPVSYLSQGDENSWSYRSAQAAAVVADGAPEAFNDFQRGLFELAAANPAPSDEEIVQAALDAGAPQEVADRIGERPYDEWVDAITRQASRDDVRGTPTVLIDGEEFEQWNAPGSLVEAISGD